MKTKLRIVKEKKPGHAPQWWVTGLEFNVDEDAYGRIGPYDLYSTAVESKNSMQLVLDEIYREENKK